MAEKLKRSPLRWSYEPGGYNNASYRLRRAGVEYAVVTPAKAGGWYSYSLDVPRDHRWNTHSEPCELEQAKSDAMARARRALEES